LFKAGDVVDTAALIATGIIPGDKDGVKILAFGTLDKKLKVTANKCSAQAQAKIEAAGGEVILN
jgi:large subunit ribosomal protein L15